MSVGCNGNSDVELSALHSLCPRKRQPFCRISPPPLVRIRSAPFCVRRLRALFDNVSCACSAHTEQIHRFERHSLACFMSGQVTDLTEDAKALVGFEWWSKMHMTCGAFLHTLTARRSLDLLRL